MNFTKDEKLAIGKALRELAMADDKLTVGEVNYMKQLGDVVGITLDIYEESWNIQLNYAVSTLRKMSNDKKAALAIMLNEMAHADGHLAVEEVEVMISVFAAAGIRLPK